MLSRRQSNVGFNLQKRDALGCSRLHASSASCPMCSRWEGRTAALCLLYRLRVKTALRLQVKQNKMVLDKTFNVYN